VYQSSSVRTDAGHSYTLWVRRVIGFKSGRKDRRRVKVGSRKIVGSESVGSLDRLWVRSRSEAWIDCFAGLDFGFGLSGCKVGSK
jgi:hypothetical protein